MRSGNLIEAIWLNKDNVQNAYARVGRLDIKLIISNLINMLENISFTQGWLVDYKNDAIKYMEEKHKINSLFPNEFAQDILKVLKQIDSKEENLKRVLSIKCFGDSKYFEKNIEHILIRIIKKYLLKNENLEEYNDDDILREAGISKYPEILEFCGDLEYYINNQKIEYKKETMGSYINSFNVEQMSQLKIFNANKIIFIENKANYVDYIQNKKKDNEFVVYHGGMYSPIKGEFFKKLYDAEKSAEFYHWSDIDIGGFRIFVKLKNIIPNLQEYKMNVKEFYEKRQFWKKMNPDYCKRLKSLKTDSRYIMFYDVIDAMIENNSKLEQEAFLV